MNYISRKFSNIRFKKIKVFKPRQFTGSSSNKSGSKPAYQSGYKIDTMENSKIIYYNCNDLGHFANECKKPKQFKKDKDYLELESKYQALLKKQQGKTYISKEKYCDNSDNDEDNT